MYSTSKKYATIESVEATQSLVEYVLKLVNDLESRVKSLEKTCEKEPAKATKKKGES